MSATIEAVSCIGCNEKATHKTYRQRYGIIDGYPACEKHFQMDDLNFWKAVNKKPADCPCCLCVGARAVGA
jgi:hypothetical protein